MSRNRRVYPFEVQLFGSCIEGLFTADEGCLDTIMLADGTEVAIEGFRNRALRRTSYGTPVPEEAAALVDLIAPHVARLHEDDILATRTDYGRDTAPIYL